MPSLSRTMTSLRFGRSQMAVTNIPRSLRDEILPPFLVGVDDGLGVGPRPENVAARLELLPELGEIVDLAVVGRPDRQVLVGQRLVPAREVDDAQAPRPQAHPGLDVDALRRQVPGG